MSKMKYLWTAALIALCVTAVSTAAFAAPSWDATADSGFPEAMVWDQAVDVTIDATNDGTTAWDTNYKLWSIRGTTTTPVPIDRWGLDAVPEAGITPPVAAGESITFEFTITAPPITTLEYLEAAEVTSTYDTLECDWLMYAGATKIDTDIVEKDIIISRFPDVNPGRLGEWARHSIEMCAGRVPLVVQGYPDGSYGPQVTVSRDIMAVFIFRAAKIAATTPAEATFDDVPTDYWAYTAVESLVAEGIVEGYNPTTYAPANAVTRAQQAVFVARTLDYTLARDEDGNSTLTEDPFLDVPWDFWAGPEIQAGVDEGVIQGYPDDYYRPTVILSRDQMAVFVDRAFIVPTGQPVVLGGPDVVIWGDQSHADEDPEIAYVLFDTARLDTNVDGDDNGQWEFTFEYRDADVPTSVVDSTTENVPVGDITTAKAGTDVYFAVAVAVPVLAAGDYILTVLVEDETGTLSEVNPVEDDPDAQSGRVVTFTITP